MKETENITEEKQEQQIKTAPARPWKKWFSNDWVARNMYYFLFLAVLAVIYIYNGHYAENTIKDINRTAKELKELQYEYKTVKGELMMRGKQSELAKAVEPLGLKELKTPPVKIVESREK